MVFNKWHSWLMLKKEFNLYISVFDIMQMIFDRDLNNNEFNELTRIIREDEKIRRDLSCFIPAELSLQDKIV